MNKRLARARAEHDKWLEKRGLLPAQIRARLGKPKLLQPWDVKPIVYDIHGRRQLHMGEDP